MKLSRHRLKTTLNTKNVEDDTKKEGRTWKKTDRKDSIDLKYKTQNNNMETNNQRIWNSVPNDFTKTTESIFNHNFNKKELLSGIITDNKVEQKEDTKHAEDDINEKIRSFKCLTGSTLLWVALNTYWI